MSGLSGKRNDPQRPDWLAGAPGFEPGNGGIKIRCLTTWLRPNVPAARLRRQAATGRRTIAMREAPINVGAAVLARRGAPRLWTRAP
jgi:hypothetical protein